MTSEQSKGPDHRTKTLISSVGYGLFSRMGIFFLVSSMFKTLKVNKEIANITGMSLYSFQQEVLLQRKATGK